MKYAIRPLLTKTARWKVWQLSMMRFRSGPLVIFSGGGIKQYQFWTSRVPWRSSPRRPVRKQLGSWDKVDSTSFRFLMNQGKWKSTIQLPNDGTSRLVGTLRPSSYHLGIVKILQKVSCSFIRTEILLSETKTHGVAANQNHSTMYLKTPNWNKTIFGSVSRHE